MWCTRRLLPAVMAAATILGPAGLPAQRPALDPRWVPVDGRAALLMHGRDPGVSVDHGSVTAPDLRLRDGVVEFDLRGGPDGFAGVEFRMQDDANYDVIYFRSDTAGRWVEAQYQGVYQGETSWQLYPDRPYTAPVASMPRVDSWVHVRLELSGARARIWMGSDSVPVLDVPEMKRDAQRGYLGVWGQGSTTRPRGGVAEIAGLRIDTSHVPGLAGVAAAEPEPRAIRTWAVTGRLLPPDTGGTPDELPAALLASDTAWRAASVEASGLVNLTREVGNASGPQSHNLFGGGASGMALARTSFVVTGASDRTLELGFSDRVSVFLDGRLVYRGDNSYEVPGSDLGRVRYRNASIPLRLSAGAHTLVLAVVDRKFGWGFKARWAE